MPDLVVNIVIDSSSGPDDRDSASIVIIYTLLDNSFVFFGDRSKLSMTSMHWFNRKSLVAMWGGTLTWTKTKLF